MGVLASHDDLILRGIAPASVLQVFMRALTVSASVSNDFISADKISTSKHVTVS